MIETTMNVITFRSTHHAMKTEKALKNANLDIKMIPTPREITASCGLSIKFKDEDRDAIFEILRKLVSEEGIILKGVFKIVRTKEKVELEEMDIDE